MLRAISKSPSHHLNVTASQCKAISTAAIWSNVFSRAIKCFTRGKPLTALKQFNKIKGWQDTAEASVHVCFEKWRHLSNKSLRPELVHTHMQPCTHTHTHRVSVSPCSEGVRSVLATAWHQTDPCYPHTMLTLGINTWTPEKDVGWGPMCMLSVFVARACVLVFLGDWGRGRRAPPASSQTQWRESEECSLLLRFLMTHTLILVLYWLFVFLYTVTVDQ